MRIFFHSQSLCSNFQKFLNKFNDLIIVIFCTHFEDAFKKNHSEIHLDEIVAK